MAMNESKSYQSVFKTKEHEIEVRQNPETDKYEIFQDGKRMLSKNGNPADGGGHDVFDTAQRQAGHIVAGIEKRERQSAQDESAVAE